MDTTAEKTAVLAALERAWAGTCRVVLMGEVGPLMEFEPYLTRRKEKCRLEKSLISGKRVAVIGTYPKGSRFISDKEAKQYLEKTKGMKLDINSVKDIDSAIGAFSEIAAYAGDVVLGRSYGVLESTKVVESSYVFSSSDAIYSKFIAFTQIAKYSENVFGCISAGKNSRFAIACAESYESARTFECFYVYHASDCVYSANVENCQDCIFSFNLRGKRRCIGNLELAPDKYRQLKEKLLSEARQMLSEKKSLPSIYDIVRGKT